MQKKHYFSVLAMVGALSTAVLTGCVDEDYDLDKVDTTMQFQIKDLTLPLNLAPVKLDDLIDLTSEEVIDTINGEYVLIKEGSFTSDEIEIGRIDAVPTIDDNESYNLPIPEIVGGLKVPMTPYVHHFHYTYDNVDEYILRIDSGTVQMPMTLRIIARNNNGKAIPGKFTNLKLSLPKGLYGTVNKTIKIDSQSSNEVVFTEEYTDNNGVLSIDFQVTKFDFKASGAKLEDRVFALNAELGIISGDFEANKSQDGTGVLTTELDVKTLIVDDVSGEIYYDVDDLDVNENISLSDLPDVLTDKRTNISLRNPQLYLSVNNPLGYIGLTASTGFILSQVRAEGPERQAKLAQPLHIAGVEGQQTFCLLPHPEDLKAPYSKYPNAVLCAMTGFGEIISGEGLPEALKAEFENPMIDRQIVKNFPLGRNFGNVSGDYTLYAPLELGNGSVIYYEDSATGWGLTSDSDEMDLKLLIVEADVTSNLPISVDLTVEPLDTDGHIIPDLTVTPVVIPAADKKHIEIKVEGNIIGLDGMNYKAIIRSADDAKALSPDASLVLDNLKVRVTGNYLIKDDK